MATSLTGLNERSQDVQILLQAIAEQEAVIERLEAERAALGSQAPAADQDEADQRVLQAHQYLSELRIDLESALQTPIGPEDRDAGEEAFESDESGPDGLAIVIGHSPRGDNGACGVPPLPDRPEDGKCEYFWNRELAGWIKEELTAINVPCEIFHRHKNGKPGILDAYREVIRWRPKATVELHFNASSGQAEGSETLFERPDSESWARKLQSSLVKLFGHEGKRTERGAPLDRGIKLASKNGRGTVSLIQIGPSALIEPFFGDNTSDATRGVTNKRALAKTIARAYTEFVGAAVSPGAGPSPQAGAGTTPPPPPPPVTATLWDQLRTAYSRARIEFPHLKAITFSQWALESGFGSSDLAKLHLNFGGMKFRPFLADIAEPVDYKGDKYCKFKSFEAFFAGYWRRFDKISNYDGWRDHTRTQDDYLGFIGPIYAPPAENPNYIPKIMALFDRLKSRGELPSITDGPVEPDNPVQVVGDMAALIGQAAPSEATHFVDLVRRYANRLIPHPSLRLVSVAQWALESNWGRSDLARIHFNFAGIEWSEALKEFAAPVEYKRGDGVTGQYCRFASLEDFCDAYWARFALDGRFADVQAHTASAEDFLRHVAPILRPGEADYAGKTLGILARLQAALAPSPGGSASTSQPQPDTPATGGSAPLQQGFVIHIRRTHTEQRQGRKHRTVGRYQVFFNGEKLDGLEGMSFETWGPGDNTRQGVRNERRVEAKTYQLFTHHGEKTVPDVNGVPKTAFVTHGFTSNERTRIPSMPSLRLGGTGTRSGVLFHPAEGWIWSVGCLHLSTPLNGPSSNINYKDSRARVIAVIDAMRSKLGNTFPAKNNELIPGAKVVIEGEPLPGGEMERLRPESDEALEIFEAEGVTEDPNLVPDEEAFDLVAATMNGTGAPMLISHARFLKLAAQRSDILSLRGASGQNLWSEWAGGWEASFALGEAARNFIQGELRKIADALTQAGLSINDDAGLLTPMTTAAGADEANAVKELHQRGGNIEQPNRQGNTPLAVAAFNGAEQAVKALLALGADRAAKTAGSQAAPGGQSDDFQGPVAAPLWTQEYAETCPPGATPRECAQAGRRLSEGEPEREAAYDRIIAAL